MDNEEYEVLAGLFHRATGHLAPGKDSPALYPPTAPPEEGED